MKRTKGMAVLVVSAMVVLGTHALAQDANGVSKVEVTISNQEGDAFIADIQKYGKDTTRQRIEEYTVSQIQEALKKVGLWNPNHGSALKAAMKFSTGNWYTAVWPGYNTVSKGVYVESTASVSKPNAPEQELCRFSGGCVFLTASQWSAVTETVDLHIGQILAAFARKGVKPEVIFRYLVIEDWLPRNRVAHGNAVGGFGGASLRQTGNLWETLEGIGMLQVTGVLRQMLSATDSRDRLQAANALSELKAVDALPDLQARLTTERDQSVAAAIESAIKTLQAAKTDDQQRQ